MSVPHILCLNGRYQDCSKLTITDETAYSLSAPDRRQDAARVLFGAKMDENQVLTYIDSIVNTDPLTNLTWTFNSSGDGAYRFFYIDIPLYAPGDTYVKEIKDVNGFVTQYGNIIYHTTSETYYKAIGTSFSGIEPSVTSGWETSWEVYNIQGLKLELLSDKIDVFTHDDVSDCAYSSCVVKTIDKNTDKELCGLCIDSEEFLKVIKMQFLLDAAESNNWQDKVTRSEIILKEATKKYCCA